jgi:hypothetical protein
MATAIETTVLMDSPGDFGCEERGWVPVEFAATAEEAVKRIAQDVELFDPDNFEYRADGSKSWHRPLAIAQEDNDTWFVPEKTGSEEYEGQKGEWWEYCPWDECEPDDEGAVEFWNIEVVEVGDEEMSR